MVSHVTLAAALRATGDDELVRLLSARRDLATPPPADTDVLATRAGTPGSVARACEQLDTFAVTVLDALLLLDADVTPAAMAEIDKLVGVDCTPGVHALRTLALAWADEDGAVSVVRATRDVLGPFPAGLGRPLPALDDVDIAAALAEVTVEERRLLATLAAGPPVGKTRDATSDVPLAEAGTAVQRLLARGLLIRRDAGSVELPRQVAVHLRGGRVFGDTAQSEPPLPVRPHTTATVDRAGAGEAMELNRHVEALLRSWSRTPPPVLKAGGLGVRELRRIMRDLDVDEARAVLLAELVVGAGLAADSRQTSPEWVPTTLTDSWLVAPPAVQWAMVAETWLGLPRLPGLAHTELDSGATDDRPPSPLSDGLHRPHAPASRRRVLAALAGLPPGTGIADGADLVAVLAWRAPRRGGRLRDDVVRWTLSEAAGVGLVALGALTTAARALLAEPGTTDEDPRAGAIVAMTDALPPPVDHFLVQADLTVVAPGPLEPPLAAEIAAVADVESAGHATVYRVTEASVRRALDSGRTADDLHGLFTTRSRTPVPQGLSYLIDDVARRHGRLRGGACASFLRCDDEALLAEVLGNPATAELALRRIAPTVLVSSLPLAEVIEGLRAHGYAPAAEGADGRVVDLRPAGRRIPAGRSTARGVPSGVVDTDRVAAVVARIRAGDRAAGTRRGARVRNPAGTADTSTTLALLADAAKRHGEVWIGFVDANGTAGERIVRAIRVGNGVLEGSDGQRFPLHRITSAALVE